MFNNDVTQTYNHLDASAEILIMLAGAFLLGCLLCWLFREYLQSNNAHKVSSGGYDDNINTQNFSKSSLIRESSELPANNLLDDQLPPKKQHSDFTIVNGITPKIEKALREKNINSYSDLRDIDKKTLSEIQNLSALDTSTKKMVKTWPHQATLAAKGDWRKLSEYQDFIEQTILKKEDSDTEKNNNLQKIKGVGPQVEKILNDKGIYTYKHLKKADATILKEYITSADKRFKNNQTATWAHQASMADKGQWKELVIYQEFMEDVNIDSKNLAATVNKSILSNSSERKSIIDKNTSENSSLNAPSILTTLPIKQQNVEINKKDHSTEAKKHSSNKNQQILSEESTPNLSTNISSSSNLNKSKKKSNKQSIEQDNLANKETPDDLKKLKGIEPKIETLLNDNGIYSFKQLYKHDRNSLKSMLKKAGSNYQEYEPKTWPHQAGMAAREEWTELKTYQGYVENNNTSLIPKHNDTNTTHSKKDDLKVIEGIGPKIESVLNNANIMTYIDLKKSNRETLKSLLTNAGPQYRMHEPETWPLQAEMANNKEWDKLEKYQNLLIGGRK